MSVCESAKKAGAGCVVCARARVCVCVWVCVCVCARAHRVCACHFVSARVVLCGKVRTIAHKSA